MTRKTHATRRHGWRAVLALVTIAAAASIAPAAASAGGPSEIVLRWNAHAIAAIGNPATATPPGLGQPPPLAPIHLAMVQIAVYDAVNAIDRRHEPYLQGLPRAPRSASKNAAVATAAHDVLVGLAAASPAVVTSLDGLLAASMRGIRPGRSKDAGIAIGRAAAAGILAERSGDGRFGTKMFEIGDEPGEWVLVPPLSNNAFAWVGEVEPFALRRPDQYRAKPPLDLASAEYAAEFDEVKALGRQTGSARTPKQQSLAGWASGNPFVFMNQGLRDIAKAERLYTAEQARLFAITSVASADALIACWNNKDFYDTWRPQTAIRMAATDGNPATTADPEWLSLIPNPGYPDLPSGFNCLSAGIWHAARLYFDSDRMRFQLTSPGIVAAPPNVPVGVPGSTRTYTRFSQVIRDSIEGRILNGLHFRHADEQGARLGKRAASWVFRHEFQRVD